MIGVSGRRPALEARTCRAGRWLVSTLTPGLSSSRFFRSMRTICFMTTGGSARLCVSSPLNKVRCCGPLSDEDSNRRRYCAIRCRKSGVGKVVHISFGERDGNLASNMVLLKRFLSRHPLFLWSNILLRDRAGLHSCITEGVCRASACRYP